MKITLNIALLISCSSILYSRVIPISPIYILQIALLIILIAKGVSYDFIKKTSILFVLFAIYMTIQVYLDGKISILINAFLMFLTYYMVCESLAGKDIRYIEKTAYHYVSFSIFITAIETIYRIANPIYINAPDIDGLELYLYPFKRNSLMFIDSNYTSIILFSCLMLFNLHVLNFKKYKLTYISTAALLALTLSRATIIGYIIITIFQYLCSNKSKRLIAYVIAIMLLSCIIIISSDSSSIIDIKDGSFVSKFKLLHMMYNSFSSLNIQFLLFADGLGNSDSMLDGMGAHNIIVLLYTEFGTVFSILLLTFIINNLIATRWHSTPYWLSLFIIGMSLSFFLAFVLTPLAFLTAYRKNNK